MVVMMFLLFAGVVSASGINGDYKGNPIVKLKSNGSVIDPGEVPAMIYDGKTMVPISALRNLGAEVTWDADTYSVDVKLKSSELSTKDLVNIYKNIQKLSFFTMLYDQATHLNIVNNIVRNAITVEQQNIAFKEVDRINSDSMNSMLIGAKKWGKDDYNDFEAIVIAITKAKNHLYKFDTESSRDQWFVAQSTLNSLHSRLDKSTLNDILKLSPLVLDGNYNLIE